MTKRWLLWQGLLLASLTPVASAQDTVWDGLARTQFDSDALTLRIPCVVLEDAAGDPVDGFAMAYALNLLFEAEAEQFRLVEPIQAFDVIPESCLDSLTIAGTVATYRSSSAEIDVDAAVFADRFYTLELEAVIAPAAPVLFSVVTADSRLYRRSEYLGEVGFANVGPAPFTAELVYDQSFFDAALSTFEQSLFVFEPGRIRSNCFFNDPEGLLEQVGADSYRLKSTVTAADNDKFFSVQCSVRNLDINRLDSTTDILILVIAL